MYHTYGYAAGDQRPQRAVPLSFFAILLLGVGIFGVWHSRTNEPGARATLWVFAVTLAAFTFLAILSIGPLLLPSAVLALLACVFSLGRRQPALA